jgi:hypothetical protein
VVLRCAVVLHRLLGAAWQCHFVAIMQGCGADPFSPRLIPGLVASVVVGGIGQVTNTALGVWRGGSGIS